MNDEEPNHCDGSPSSSLVGSPRCLVLGYDDSNDNVAGRHSNGANGEHGPPTNFIDVQHRRDSGDKHGDSNDSSSQEVSSISREAKVLEDSRSVVQDRVNT